MKKAKVLIAEDNKEFCARSSALFRSYGYETTVAPKDGVKVVDLIKDQEPDVVLLDVFMPRLDAIGVMQAIKSQEGIKKPIFMTMSAFDNISLEREILSSGASYYFLKPFNVDMMVERTIQLSKTFKTSHIGANGTNPMATLSQTKDVEVMVTEIIHQLGVPAHIKGYHYLRESIMLAVEDADIINSVTKALYPTVAKNFSTTPSRVERAIRHAIEVAWDRGDLEILNAYFGYTIHNGRGKPTNSEFIAMISDKLRLKLKSTLIS